MKARRVILSPEAHEDLRSIYLWLADTADPDVAINHIRRIEEFCRSLEYASHRGNRRDDVLPGLRVVGFQRRTTIAFQVLDDRVDILRIFSKGRNWTADFSG